MPKKNNKGKMSRKAKAKNGKTKTRERSQQQGIPLTKDGVCLTCIKLYERLKSLNIYDDNGATIHTEDLLTQEYVDLILQSYPEATVPEITDPDDPDYENPETEDTNQTLLMKHGLSVAPHMCYLCEKQVYNSEIFYKHVFWHTNINVLLQAAGRCNNFISRNELGSYIMKVKRVVIIKKQLTYLYVILLYFTLEIAAKK